MESKEHLLQLQNHETVSQIWSDLIDWPKRLHLEGPFLLDQLRCHQCHSIFDSCLGDGIDSIFLLEQGYAVVSNEADVSFHKIALKNAASHHVVLTLTQYDWRNLDDYKPSCLFDAVICLGNSFTYLFKLQERHKVLQNFFNLLKPGGIFIVDERNYQMILDRREQILKGQASAASRRTVYCGEKVYLNPVVIQDDLVVMYYKHKESLLEGRLSFFPFKKNELKHLLQEYFPHLSVYSDYTEGYIPTADFYQYVCKKPM